MDRQTASERITETENLTDGLEDDDANWLLDWGIARVDRLLAGITDEDADTEPDRRRPRRCKAGRAGRRHPHVPGALPAGVWRAEG
jgi:hypothetical protein